MADRHRVKPHQSPQPCVDCGVPTIRTRCRPCYLRHVDGAAWPDGIRDEHRRPYGTVGVVFRRTPNHAPIVPLVAVAASYGVLPSPLAVFLAAIAEVRAETDDPTAVQYALVVAGAATGNKPFVWPARDVWTFLSEHRPVFALLTPEGAAMVLREQAREVLC